MELPLESVPAVAKPIARPLSCRCWESARIGLSPDKTGTAIQWNRPKLPSQLLHFASFFLPSGFEALSQKGSDPFEAKLIRRTKAVVEEVQTPLKQNLILGVRQPNN